MSRPWWRSPRFLKIIISAPIFLIGYNILLIAIPDPPAVQEARIRKREQWQRRREEAYERDLERRIEENPAAFGLQWPDDEMDNTKEDGGSQERN